VTVKALNIIVLMINSIFVRIVGLIFMKETIIIMEKVFYNIMKKLKLSSNQRTLALAKITRVEKMNTTIT